MEFVESLGKRLDFAESLFIAGQHRQAGAAGQAILHDLMVMTQHAVQRRTLNPMFHRCVAGCLCRASFALCIQALSELHDYRQIDRLVETFYETHANLPFDMFLLWINSRMMAGQLDDVCKRISQYLKEDKDRSQYGAQRLTTSQYTNLMELLIFHGLVPLSSYDDALQLLKRNDRISSSTKQVYIDYVKQLSSAARNGGSGGSGSGSSGGSGSGSSGSGVNSGRNTPSSTLNSRSHTPLSTNIMNNSSDMIYSTNNESLYDSTSHATSAPSLSSSLQRRHTTLSPPRYLGPLLSSSSIIIRAIGRILLTLHRIAYAFGRIIGIHPTSTSSSSSTLSWRLQRMVTGGARTMICICIIWMIGRTISSAARYFGVSSLAAPLYKELASLLNQAFSSGFGQLFANQS